MNRCLWHGNGGLMIYCGEVMTGYDCDLKYVLPAKESSAM